MGGSLVYLDDLAAQRRLVVHLFGDRVQLVRSLAVPNHLVAWALATRTSTAGAASWTMAAFDRARLTVEARYQTAWALWQALGCEHREPHTH
jgi:hypothetical protein